MARHGFGQDVADDDALGLIDDPDAIVPPLADHEFSVAPLRPASTGPIRIHGVVRNLCSWPWDESHRVGIRNFLDDAGRPFRGPEFRATMALDTVRPGERAAFSFVLSSADVPPRAVACELDVVAEGRFWFADRGATPVRFRIAPDAGSAKSEWLTFLYHYHAISLPPVQQKLEVLQDVLHNLDFAGYQEVAGLGHAVQAQLEGRPYRPVPATSTTVAASCDRDDLAGSSAAFFQRYAIEHGVAPRDLDDPLALLGAFRGFVRDGRGFFRDGCAPLPLPLLRWLGQRALPAALARAPLTRAMVASMGRDHAVALNGDDHGTASFWWFATAVLVDGALTERLIPPALEDQLARSPRRAGHGGGFPELSPFVRRLHTDDQHYSKRYDLALDHGRCGFAFDMLLLGLRNEVRRRLLGRSVLGWMLAPIDETLAITPFELLLLASSGGGHLPRALLSGDPVGLPDGAAVLRATLDWLPRDGAWDRAPAIRVLGEHQSDTGLAVNMRMTVAALDKIGIVPEIVDVEHDLVHPPGPPRSGDAPRVARPVDIFHLNPDAVPALVARYTGWQRTDVYRIGFALWETSVMPEQQRPGASLLNEIWAPTTYVADIYRQAGFRNVHVMGKGIALPDPAPFDLRQVGVEPGDFTFMMSFDVGSWIERKNPIAAVEAFLLAFPDDPTAKLIVKTTGLHDHPGDRTRQVERILAIAEHDPRILLVDERYPFAGYLGLIAAVDATVSPHRAEGFGYVPAYSLLLGTPAIVTDYSGTTDFCSEETSFPVPYTLAELASGNFVYDAPGAHWANIDVAALARTMRQVRAEPETAHRRTVAGGRLLRERYSMDAMAARYAERLRTIP